MEIQEWQKGNESEMSSYERMIAHQEWLNQLHKEIREITLKENKQEPEILLGGFDD